MVVYFRKSPHIWFATFSILFWFLSSFPAKMTADSFAVWGQVKTGHFTDWHTVTYGYFVYLFSLGGRSIALVSIFQEALAFLAVFSMVRVIFSDLKEKTQINISSAIFITPFIGSTAVTLWKDVPYSTITIIGFGLLMGSFSKLKNEFYLGWLLIGIGSLFRHDGWFTLLLEVGFFSFWRLGQRILSINKTAIVTKRRAYLLFVILITSVWSLEIARFTHSQPTPKWMMTSSLLADLEYVNALQPNLLPTSTRNVLNLISSGQSLNGARDCKSVNPLIFQNGFHQDQADKYADKIFFLWKQAVKSEAAPLLLQAHACRGKAFIPAPFSDGPGEKSLWIVNDIEQPNSFSLHRYDIIPGLHIIQTAWTYVWQSNEHFLAWPGLHLTVAISLLSLISRRRESFTRYQFLVCYLIFHDVVLLLATPAQDFRYEYSLYFVSLPLIVRAFAWTSNKLNTKK